MSNVNRRKVIVYAAAVCELPSQWFAPRQPLGDALQRAPGRRMMTSKLRPL